MDVQEEQYQDECEASDGQVNETYGLLVESDLLVNIGLTSTISKTQAVKVCLLKLARCLLPRPRWLRKDPSTMIFVAQRTDLIS